MLNLTQNSKTTPDIVPLFSTRNIYSAFQDINLEVNFERPLVIGGLRTEYYKEPLIVEVLDFRGKVLKEVPTFYLYNVDDKDFLDRDLKHTSPDSQKFILGNLIPGEYHLQVRRWADKKVIATQVFRTNTDSISVIQY